MNAAVTAVQNEQVVVVPGRRRSQEYGAPDVAVGNAKTQAAAVEALDRGDVRDAEHDVADLPRLRALVERRGPVQALHAPGRVERAWPGLERLAPRHAERDAQSQIVGGVQRAGVLGDAAIPCEIRFDCVERA